MRLMLSVAGEEQSECVYDLVLPTKRKSMTDNVLDAVAGLDLRAMPRQLLFSMQQLLKTSDAQECADVDLKESGLRLQHARAHVQGTGDDALVLQAGTVAFVVDGTCLSTPTQGLRARCSSNGHTLVPSKLLQTTP